MKKKIKEQLKEYKECRKNIIYYLRKLKKQKRVNTKKVLGQVEDMITELKKLEMHVMKEILKVNLKVITPKINAREVHQELARERAALMTLREEIRELIGIKEDMKIAIKKLNPTLKTIYHP